MAPTGGRDAEPNALANAGDRCATFALRSRFAVDGALRVPHAESEDASSGTGTSRGAAERGLPAGSGGGRRTPGAALMALPDEVLDRIVAQLGEDGPRHVRCVNHALRRAVDERSPQLYGPLLERALQQATLRGADVAPHLVPAWRRLEAASVFYGDVAARNEALQALARRSPRLRDLHLGCDPEVRLTLLQQWPELACLRLQGGLQPEQVTALSRLPALTMLELYDVALPRDVGLTRLCALTRLTQLEVARLVVCGDEPLGGRLPAPVGTLAALPNLRALTLDGGPWGEVEPSTLAGASRELTRLTTRRSPPPVYAARLQACRGLAHLDIPRAEPWVPALSGLTELRLQQNGDITDATLRSLAPLQRLRALELGGDGAAGDAPGTPLTAAGMQHLTCLRELTSLLLHGCSSQLVDAAIAAIGTHLLRLRWHAGESPPAFGHRIVRQLEKSFAVHAFARRHDVVRFSSDLQVPAVLLLLSLHLEPGTDAVGNVTREETANLGNGLLFDARRRITPWPGSTATP